MVENYDTLLNFSLLNENKARVVVQTFNYFEETHTKLNGHYKEAMMEYPTTFLKRPIMIFAMLSLDKSEFIIKLLTRFNDISHR